MKHSKTLVVVALSATALTLSLASTASATTLEDPSGVHPTVIDATVVGTTAFTSGGSTVNTCTGGTIEGIPTTGSASTTVQTSVAKADLTWSGCTKTTDTLFGGSLEIHHKAGTSSGTVTGTTFEITMLIFGLSCIYAFTTTDAMAHLGTLTGSDTTAVLHIDTILSKFTPQSVLCPGTVEWVGSYDVTTPKGLTVTAG